MRWVREREIIMTMINVYILSWREHLQESEDVLRGGVGWLGGR